MTPRAGIPISHDDLIPDTGVGTMAHRPDRDPRRWPVGQGQRPGMIDRSPAGRRLLVALVVLGILAGSIIALVIAIIA